MQARRPGPRFNTNCCACAQEYFEPLLENPFMPAKALRLIVHGLSGEVARGEVPPPHMADIRAALKADRENVELTEVMGLLGCRL